MGYRTVVMLSNDQANEWMNDKELGRKIANASHEPMRGKRGDIGYGCVVECVHADTETLAFLDSCTGFEPLAHGFWSRDESTHEAVLKLLKDAADKLGYSLRKKPSKGE